MKIKACFLHFACHSELQMLEGGSSPLLPFHGTINSASSYVALWTGLCMPWCSTDPLLSSPSLYIFANMLPAPGSSAADPNSLMDTGRATGELGSPRDWHLYWKMKADIVGRGSSEQALCAGCPMWMESSPQGVFILWFWPSFVDQVGRTGSSLCRIALLMRRTEQQCQEPAHSNPTAQRLARLQVTPLNPLPWFDGTAFPAGVPPQTHVWEIAGIKKPQLKLQIMR